jgi:hypothetical protein
MGDRWVGLEEVVLWVGMAGWSCEREGDGGGSNTDTIRRKKKRTSSQGQPHVVTTQLEFS